MNEPTELMAMLDRAAALDATDWSEVLSAHDLEDLTRVPDVEQALVEIVKRREEPSRRRRVAVEALALGPWTRWRDQVTSRAAAQVLAEALATDVSHNRWGLPGAFLGRAGQILCDLPEGVVESLQPLLDDRRPLTIYGSEAATEQHLQQFRICDLAAFIIACHLRRPWVDDRSS
jgi:hypothetical protein